jgi:hypothetical protein
MHSRMLTAILTIMLLAMAGGAAAQDRIPEVGSVAVGFDFGVLDPQASFRASKTLDAYGEFYVTRRVSVRGTVGWSNPQFADGVGSVRQARLDASLLYNWEAEEWHPFVVAGIGGHILRLLDSDQVPVGGREKKVAGNLGAGIEYFARRKVAVKGEARYFFVRHTTLPYDPSGLVVTLGLKKYF